MGFLTSVSNHALLSTVHTDTLAGTVVRGDVIIGNSTPAWSRLAVGGANTVLGSDGTDTAWKAQTFIDHGSITGLGDDDHTQYVLRNILTTDGDLFSRGAGAIARIAAVATGQVLASAGTGTLPAWSATPTLTSLTCPTLDGGTAANDDITIQGTTHSTRTSSYVLLQPNGGKVGIGATPNAKLAVSSSSAELLDLISSSTADGYITFIEGDTVRGYIGFADQQLFVGGIADSMNFRATSTLHLGVGTTPILTMDINGLVGIWTETPTISGTGKLHMAANTFRLDTARTPASAGAVGNAGDICWDASYIYVCTATNAWERVGIASW